MYYSKFWSFSDIQPNSLCPSILLSFQGTDLTISGALFGSEGINCDFYFSTSVLPIDDDDLLRRDLARVIMGIRIASIKLKNYYTKFSTVNIPNELSLDGFPYLREIDGLKFKFESKIGNSRVFKAINIENNKQIIIKFSKRYSIPAHNNCSIAPKILKSCKVLILIII